MAPGDLPRVPPGPGLIFLTIHPVDELVEHATAAEESGLASFWLAEAYHWFRRFGLRTRSAVASLTAVAGRTSTVALGCGIVSPYTRHPTILAAEAATLQELSGGRFVLGLGAGKIGVNYTEIDLSTRPPVSVHRDAISIVRAALAGRAVDFTGDVFHAEIPALVGPRDNPVPICIGATGPKLTELAGEVADGLLLPALATPGLVERSRALLARGAARAGRPAADIPIGAYVLCSVAADGAVARDDVRRMAAIFLRNKVVNIGNDVILDCAGLSPADVPVDIDGGDVPGDAVLRQAGVVAGTPDECVEQLRPFTAAGVSFPLMAIVGPERESRCRSVRLFLDEVAPEVTADIRALNERADVHVG